MGGGLMQLVAQGADAYLTGKPEITFFKIVYRRHTAFAVNLSHKLLTVVLTTVMKLPLLSPEMVI